MQKLFTKAIDAQLFKQYQLGSELSAQMVVAKIFNPYGRGTWYIINSDPSDPDYLWCITDLFEVEVGSVSRQDLEQLKVPPFGMHLERDMYFDPVNAQELLNGLIQGKHYNLGGEMIKRADGSYSHRGLWDNIRANIGSGRKPTKEMLEQERKIKASSHANGGKTAESVKWHFEKDGKSVSGRAIVKNHNVVKVTLDSSSDGGFYRKHREEILDQIHHEIEG